MGIDLLVFVDERTLKSPDLTEAINVINRHQHSYRLKARLAGKRLGLSSKGELVDPEQLLKSIALASSGKPAFAITRQGFVGDYFTYGDSGKASLISTSAWDTNYPTRPLHLYIAAMLSANIPYVTFTLPPNIWARQEARHASGITGCIGDYCPLLPNIWQNMTMMHICAPCKREFARAGFPKQYLLDSTGLYERLRATCSLYDKRLYPDVFVSYNHNDVKIAQRLTTDLFTNGFKAFMDRQEVEAGDSILTKIGGGLSRARVFVIILSPFSIKSKWCHKELLIAIDRHIHGEITLIPLLLGDCDIAEKGHLAVFLRDVAYQRLGRGNYTEVLSHILARLQKNKRRRRLQVK